MGRERERGGGRERERKEEWGGIEWCIYASMIATQKLKQIEQLKQQQAEGKALESNQVCT